MKNSFGFLSRRPQEWGSKARKEESRLRGFSHTSRDEVIAQEIADMQPTDEEIEASDWRVGRYDETLGTQ